MRTKTQATPLVLAAGASGVRRISGMAILSVALWLSALSMYATYFLTLQHGAAAGNVESLLLNSLSLERMVSFVDRNRTTPFSSSEKTADSLPFRFQSPSKDDAPYTAFYNVYIPTDSKGIERTRKIIVEQLDQIAQSFAATKGRVLLYYNTLGNPSQRALVQTECSGRYPIVCQFMHHYDSAFEEVTLQRLWEYCHANDQRTVLYLHSKGSFHPSTDPNYSQDSWRQHMTAAITSSHCLQDALGPQHKCNVCGLQLMAWPVLHFSGNMFAAQCLYVNKLIEPLSFSTRLRQATGTGQLFRLQGKLASSFIKDMDYNFGLGRFASEHWLTSHPAARACHVSQQMDISYWRSKPRPAEEFQLSSWPSRPLSDFDNTKDKISAVLKKPENRYREYFFLPGLLVKWHVLYAELPFLDSYVWSWFPDGPEWLNATRQFGALDAVERLTKPYWGKFA